MKIGLSFKEIAEKENVDQRLIARTVQCAFLALDITSAILIGFAKGGLVVCSDTSEAVSTSFADKQGEYREFLGQSLTHAHKSPGSWLIYAALEAYSLIHEQGISGLFSEEIWELPLGALPLTALTLLAVQDALVHAQCG